MKKVFNDFAFVATCVFLLSVGGLLLDCEWWNPSGAVEYLKRGKKVYISGKLLQNNWEDKDTGAKQHKYFISVKELELRLNAIRRDDDKEDVSDEDTPSSDGDIKDVPF